MFKRIILIPFLFFWGCSQKQQSNYQLRNLKIFPAKGNVLTSDCLSRPQVVIIDETKLKKVIASSPKITPANINIHAAGMPKIVFVGQPRVCTPGADTFSLPKVINVIGKRKLAGIPEVIITKDAAVKDFNPANFSFYKALQGLKLNVVRSMLQDKAGNLWISTNGGGVCRYDGKSFTNFTEKEGLANNSVWCILEDKRGNIWFGTSCGACRYDGKYFTNINEKDGLPNNIVMSMLEDKNGNIWFGTYGGVCRFDGNTFVNFTTKEGLSNNFVNSILEDKIGNLWFATIGGGVNRFDGKSFTWYTDKEGLPNNNVNSVLEDKVGNIWFGTQNGGACRYDGNIVEEIERGENTILNKHQDIKSEKGKSIKSIAIYTEHEGLLNNFVYSILEDAKGDLWFGTNSGVCRFDGESFTNFTENEGLSNNLVFSILEDKTGALWLSTNGGACHYDGKSFTNFTEKEGLSNNIVNSILEDKTGNFWFGTYGGGICRYDSKSFLSYTTEEGFLHNTVWCSLEDKAGNLWFGTFGGVCRYDGKSFTNFTEKEGLPNNVVCSILEDKKGNIWFGTNGGACRYDGNIVEAIERGEHVPLNNRKDIKRENGKLIKCFTNFTEKEGLSNNFINAILEDKTGNLWFGTYGGGMCRYNGKSFVRFAEKEGFSNNISSIIEDKSGCLWFGTYDQGVFRYDGKSFINFSEKEGLINNAVLNVIQDTEGNVWFGTRKGLSKITSNKLTYVTDISNVANEFNPISEVLFYNYGYNDGFIGLSCRRNSVMQDRKGRIWWGTDMLTCYDPKGDIIDTTAPRVQLKKIELYNEDITWANLGAIKYDSAAREIIAGRINDTLLSNGIWLKDIKFDGLTNWYSLPEHLSLPYNNNNLSFNFIGVHVQSRNHIKYQFKLEGMDQNWSSITERTEASYGNLPSGDYVFKVKAMNQSGVWSSPFEFKFEVRPPWWKTWWFRTLVGLIIVSSVWYYIKWRERALRVRKKELEVKIEEATEEIKEKQKEIIDSIRYAQRIQKAHLPTEKYIESSINKLKKD